MAFVSDSDNSYRFGWVGEIDPYGYFS
ncbi:alkaline phosphatase, partial [Escherichia coli O113]|nr:alkaline phosphatase [Escherichia coli O113]